VDFGHVPAHGLLRSGAVLRTVREGFLLRAGRGMRVPMTTEALESVWQEMHASLLRFIARRVSDPRDAEDVLQEVMLRIHRHAGEMDEYENLGAWVHRVARSAIVDFYRRRAARPELPGGSGVDVAGTTLAPESAEEGRSELAQCLRPLIGRLDDKYREALELTELNGLSQVAAAERLELSVSGMKTRVQRGRSQLRELLLECCHIELDARGGVAEYRTRAERCGGCGCSAR
jgi:RNA polymerase sigma-70 factor (ECF subfamily)